MRCARCKKEHDEAALRAASFLLRILAFPYVALMRFGQVMSEANAKYCPSCRRQMNVCLFFFAFLVILMGAFLIMQKMKAGI